MGYIFVERPEAEFVTNSNFSRKDVRTDIVHAVQKQLPIFKRHNYVHGSYLLHRNVDTPF
jgi:hypothetical protein